MRTSKNQEKLAVTLWSDQLQLVQPCRAHLHPQADDSAAGKRRAATEAQYAPLQL